MTYNDLTLYEYFEPIRNNPENTFYVLKESVNTTNNIKKTLEIKKELKKLGVDISSIETQVKTDSFKLAQELKNEKIENLDKKSLSKKFISTLNKSITKLSDIINEKIDSKFVKGALIGGAYLCIQLSLEIILGYFLGPTGISIAASILSPLTDSVLSMIAADTNSSGIYFLVSSAVSIKNLTKNLLGNKKNIVAVITQLSNLLNRYDTVNNYAKIKDNETSEERTKRNITSAIINSIVGAIAISFQFLVGKIFKIK